MAAIQVKIHDITIEAIRVYATNPMAFRCIMRAIAECIEKIKDCREEGDDGGAPPDCPPGWVLVGNRCVPRI